MKHLFTSIAYLLFQILSIGISHSQQVNWGPEYTWDQKNKVVSMKEYIPRTYAGWDNSGFYFLFEENQSDLGVTLTPIIEKYDYNLNKIYSQKLPQEIIDVIIVKQTPFLFSLATNIDTKEDFLSVETLDKQGNLIPKKTLIDISDNKKPYYYDWSAKPSTDSSTVGIFLYAFNTAKDGASIRYKVMDDKLKILSEYSFSLAYHYDDIDVEDFCIDKNDNLHILVSMEKSKATYKLISYFVADKKIVETEITPDNGFINSPTIMTPKNGAPFICGFVTESGNSKAKGFFFKKVAASSSATTQLNYHEFDKNLYADLFPSKKLDKDLFIKDLSIKDLIVTKDNSYILLAEQYTPEIMMAYKISRVGSILAIKTDTVGNLKWWRGIYKVQDKKLPNYGGAGHVSNPNKPYAPDNTINGWAQARESYDKQINKDFLPFYSYSYCIKGDDLIIIYADNAKNKTNTAVNDIKLLDENDDRQPIQLTLSSNGSFKKEILTLGEGRDLRMKLNFYSQQGGFIIYDHHKKKGNLIYQFGKIGFK